MFFVRCYFCVSMLAALLESIVFHVLSSPCSAGTIFLPFYRHRAARKQYLCHFIVAVQRGNNIFAVLSSPRGAETISLPFYRHRAARKQYFRVLSSPRGAGTIFLPFYRHRVAREQYFRVSVLAALLRALKFLFSSLQNGGTCWNGRGGAYVPARTSAQRRFYTKNTRIVCGGGTMDAPLQGDTGGHIGTAPTHLHHTSFCIIPLNDIIHPRAIRP